MPTDSLWLDGQTQRYESLSGEETTDVLVVGGGIAGLTSAYLLSMAGVNVTVLEAQTIGSGISGHGTAHVTSQHDLTHEKRIKRFGMDMAKAIAHADEKAIRLIAGIINAEGIQCDFTPQDSYVYTEDAAGVRDIEREAEAASRLGICADVTNQVKFILPYRAAVRFYDQAMLHPVKYLNGLAGAVAGNGGRIHEHSRVLHIKDGMARTAAGSVRAKCILLATRVPIATVPGWYRAMMIQRRAYAASVENAPLPEGMWVNAAKDGYTYRTHGNKLVIGGEQHRCGAEPEIEHFASLRKYIIEYFPEGRLTGFWSGQDAMTLDGLPYIGRYSDKSRNLFIATGFGLWGMTQGTTAGQLLCDLVLDRKNQYAEIYSPQRAPVPAAIGHALSMNLATAWHYASGGFHEGCPACSHLRCRLVWNRDERSWDCPCHGSRFAEDGSILDAPAVQGIEPRAGL